MSDEGQEQTGIPKDLPLDLRQTWEPLAPQGLPLKPAAVTEISHEGLDPAKGPEAPTGGEAGSRFVAEELIDVGGFGEVWRVTQTSLDRTVALKRIRPDLLEKRTPPHRRVMEDLFREEARTAASLEHPNILPVYDLCETEDGHPTLAMKLVEGEPWDAIIDRDLVTLPTEIFLSRHIPILIAMANAVAFSHHKGVVHRDLKPGQVMIGKFGEVLLMDWGLAIRMDAPPQKIDRSPGEPFRVITRTATNPAGTPAFMAPEQTELTTAHLGYWTDIYLLGGTLYQLITGSAPHDADSREQSYRRARSGRVPHPSTVSSAREFPPELAEIAMRALQPKIADRTPSVLKFVEELNDYLSGARRRRDAEQIVSEAETVLHTATTDYDKLSGVLANLARARTMWPQSQQIAQLQEHAAKNFAEIALASGDHKLARVQATGIADVVMKEELLGRIKKGERQLELERHQRRFAFAGIAALLILFGLGGVRYALDQKAARELADAARNDAEQARARAEKLTDFMLTEVASELRPIGRLRLMDDVARGALDYYESIGEGPLNSDARARHALALGNIGEVFRDTGKSEEARRATEKSLAIREALAAKHPGDLSLRRDVVRSHNALARLVRPLGNAAAARDQAELALASARQLDKDFPGREEVRRELAAALTGLALARRGEGDEAGARALMEEVLSMAQESLKAEPDSFWLRVDLASAYSNLAQILQAQRDAKGALAALDSSISIRESLHRENPDNTSNAYSLGRTLLSSAQLKVATGDLPGGKETLAKARHMFERLDAIDSLNLDWERDLGTCLNIEGALLEQSGENEQAITVLRRALEVREYLVRQDSANTGWLRDLSVTLNLLSRTLSTVGQREAALETAERDLEITKRLVASDPSNRPWKHDLAVSHQAVAEMLIDLKRSSDAFDHLSAASEIFEAFRKDAPTEVDAANDAAWSKFLIGQVQSSDNIESAKATWAEAAEILAPFCGADSEIEPGILDTYARILIRLDRRIDAAVVVDRLRKVGWENEEFWEMVKKAGL